jgi:hypothetical protein
LKNNQLGVISSVKIKESEETVISSLTQASFLSDQIVLLLSSERNINALNTNTGELSPFISIDSSQAQNIFKFVISQYKEIHFLNDTLKKDDYTMRIGRFQIVDNCLYVSIISQFYVLGKLDDTEASVFSYFYTIQKYDLKTKQLLAQFSIPDNVTINYSKNKADKDSYLSPLQGFYLDVVNSKIYSKTNASPISENSSFLVQFDLSSKLENKVILPIYHNLNKQCRKDYSFGYCSFFNLNNQLFCSDGKDIFTIQPYQKLYREVISNKYEHIKSFKIINDNEILYNKGCDTSNYSAVYILKNGKDLELIPNSGMKKLFIFQKGIHAITLRGKNYFFETYENN